MNLGLPNVSGPLGKLLTALLGMESEEKFIPTNRKIEQSTLFASALQSLTSLYVGLNNNQHTLALKQYFS